MKIKHYTLNFNNRMKGKYKIFALTPCLSVCRDTQISELGWSSWEFYFEWLWFQIDFSIETEEAKAFIYCQAQIEEGKKCKEQCDHCKDYYKPLEQLNK